MATVIDTPEGINLVHLASLRGALRLEKLGMKRSRRPSALTIAKQEFNLPKRASYDLAINLLTERIEAIHAAREVK